MKKLVLGILPILLAVTITALPTKKAKAEIFCYAPDAFCAINLVVMLGITLFAMNDEPEAEAYVSMYADKQEQLEDMYAEFRASEGTDNDLYTKMWTRWTPNRTNAFNKLVKRGEKGQLEDFKNGRFMGTKNILKKYPQLVNDLELFKQFLTGYYSIEVLDRVYPTNSNDLNVQASAYAKLAKDYRWLYSYGRFK